MSFSLTLRPPRNVCRLSFVMRTPWRRSMDLTTVSDADFVSPRTLRLLRSMPSQRKVYSLTPVGRRVWVVAATAMMTMSCWLFVSDCFDFFEGGHALFDFEESRLAQILDALQLRLLGNLEHVGAAHDQLAHRIGDRHHLVDAQAALVAGPLAVVTTHRAIGLPGAVEIFLREPGLEQRLRRNILRAPALRAKFA